VPALAGRQLSVTLMLARESENVPPVLEMAAAMYKGSAGQLPPVDRGRLIQRASHVAACVRFSLAEPEAMCRLHGVTKDFHDVARLDSLLPRILDGALSLTGADFGNIQLLDPVSGSLWLVTHSGFGPEFLDHFAMVYDGGSACARAAQACAQAVIADVDTDESFAPHRDIAAASGFRAVQSTPLTDYGGRLIGVISTHFRRPGRPPAQDLWAMELYGDAAGEAIGWHLGVPSAGEGAGDPAGRAVLSALLGPADDRTADVTAVSGLGNGQGSRERRLMGLPASRDNAMSQVTDDFVRRLFFVGLSLERARSIVGDSPAADWVSAAADEVDRTIRDIWAILFGLDDQFQGMDCRDRARAPKISL
jgi:hypothetical protein